MYGIATIHDFNSTLRSRKTLCHKPVLFLGLNVLCHLNYLLPEKNVLLIDHFVIMVVSEQPVVEFGSILDFLKEVGQAIVNISAVAYYILDAAGRAVGDDVIHLVMGPLQVVPGFFVFSVRRQLLLPPGPVVDPEPGAHPAEHPVLLLKVRSLRVQDPVLNIVATGAAHGEEGVSLQVKDLSAHQVDHMRPDELYLPAAPFLHRVFCQPVKVLMIPADEQGGKRQRFQPVQAALVFLSTIPDAAEVAADDHVVLYGHAGLLREVFRLKALKITVGITGGIIYSIQLPFFHTNNTTHILE